MPSIEILQGLPAVEPLRQKAQALAAMDAIMSPDWEYRYFLFNSKWSTGEMMASIANGSGDDLFLLFTKAGAILKGFDHESLMSPWARDEKALWQGLFTSVPVEFAAFLTEPAFTIPNSTFCAWRQANSNVWQSDKIEYPNGDCNADGSKWMLQEYIESARRYVEFCKEYYEQDVPLATVEQFYSYKPLTEKMVLDLNAKITLSTVLNDMIEISYPICL